MAKIHDIQARDEVSLSIPKEDLNRVENFIENLDSNEEGQFYFDSSYSFLSNRRNSYKVVKALRTKKTKTEYAVLIPANAEIKEEDDWYDVETFPIQTRYLTLRNRPNKHRITKIFQ